MKQLSDRVVARLTADMQAPDVSGTRYNLLHFLARGGMASVWLVQDTVLNRRVALKVLDLVSATDDLATRLLQEACILASLEHPGIVPVHDAGTLTDGRVFYCMKYVEGQTLAQQVASTSLPQKLRLVERIAEPLDFAHARGFLHRDLKPENIMIGPFGEVLVMDWGLAKITSRETNLPEGSSGARIQGGIVGTPGYMSPEQGRGNPAVDHRTDIYSLGAILWFLLNRSAPGQGAPIPTREARPLRAICDKAMATDPNARYQSAGEMASDVARYLNGAPVHAYRESLLERAGRIFARHRTAVVLVGAYLLMRVLFILFARH
jgi:serine/threonine protein kinase